ncbi:hypothetical protein CNR22_18810 [Sphingobacteriaceae bacterium]|nr:hypothetical protein CNR22_18810 [Sphingobacteriaceae bacterium]
MVLNCLRHPHKKKFTPVIIFNSENSFMNLPAILKTKVILLFLCMTSLLYSQKNSEKGDRYFDQNLFEMAIKYYEMDIHSKSKKVAEYALQKMANCYRISGEFEKAEETFKKILRKKKKEPLNYLNYGLALKNSAKYAEASVQLQEYVKMKPEDKMGLVYLQSCDSAQLWLDQTLGKEVKNLENINTELADFSPTFLTPKELYFSSSREGSKRALISFDGGGDIHRLDLYTINIDKIEEKQNIQNTLVNFKEINTPLHEGPACFSNEGTELYFTKTIKGKRDKETNEILGTLQVFYSKKDTAGHWSVPVSAFDFNSANYSVGHPSISQDGQTIYFMSDKPGGFGKTDIYYSQKNAKGSWGAPVNAGNKVNTFGHELFPNISATGELYFSSNAHPGMGQLDVFRATKINGEWNNVHNLKPPINSIANDFGIVFDGDQPRGFFSSDRFNGKGAEDIYSFSEELPLTFTIRNDSLILRDLTIFDNTSYKLSNQTDSLALNLEITSGYMTVLLEKEKTYQLTASRYGMKHNTVIFNFSKNTADTSMTLNFKTEKDIQVFGSFYVGTKTTSLLKEPNYEPLRSTEISGYPGEKNIGLSKDGYFTFSAFISGGTETKISSDDVIREVPRKD